MKENNIIVQVRNPKTRCYLKIDRSKGIILARKRDERPFKGIPIVTKIKTPHK